LETIRRFRVTRAHSRAFTWCLLRSSRKIFGGHDHGWRGLHGQWRSDWPNQPNTSANSPHLISPHPNLIRQKPHSHSVRKIR